MQLQNLQNPFSFYNNPALWPKLHPFQEKMIQTVQSMNDQNSSNPLMMQQFALPNHDQTVQGHNVNDLLYEQTTGASLAIEEQYAKLCINPKMAELENALNGMSSSFISTSNPVDSTIVAAKADGIEQQVNSSFQAQLGGINKSVDFTSQQEGDQMAEFDCFQEMNVSKDNMMWWAHDFDTKSASSNSWDSTSVLQSQGMFQDYELGYNL